MVVPIYNDQEVISELLRRLSAVLEQIVNDYEIILVDDGSRDQSWEIMQAERANYAHLRIAHLSRNFGQQNAIAAGLSLTTKELIVLMDSDLQDRPEDIPVLIDALLANEQATMAIAQWEERKDSRMKIAVSRLFQRVSNSITDIHTMPRLGNVIFKNGFDGKHKIMAAVTPLRMVCQNQFNFAFKNAENTITIRHVQNAEKKLEEARETLKLSADYMQELNIMAERFAGLQMSKTMIDKVIDHLFPIPNDTAINPMKRKSLEDRREAFKKAYNQDDNGNFRGTAWGLVNAYTDMMTHKEPAGNRSDRYEGKFVTTTFKVTMNPIINAIEMVA